MRTEHITTISDGGLYIKTLTPEPANVILPLKIFIRNREVLVKAVVLYSSVKTGEQHKEPGMAMKFVSISPEDKAFINDFIKKQIMKDLSMPGR